MEAPSTATKDDEAFRAPLPVNATSDAWKNQGNINQNNAASYDSSYSTAGLGGMDSSNVPVQPSSSWPLVDGKQPQQQHRAPPALTRPPPHSQYGQYPSQTPNHDGALHHQHMNNIRPSSFGSAWQANQYNQHQQGYRDMNYYPHGYGGSYAGIYSSHSQAGMYHQGIEAQHTTGNMGSFSGAPYSQWGWSPRSGRRAPLHHNAYSGSAYTYQSSSAPPSASNSINDVESTQSQSYLSQIYGPEETQDDFTLNYPHVMEQNNEPFEYQMDLTQKPTSLEDAMRMYIDYLIAENEHKTRISHCMPMSVSSPINKETYYQELIGKPTPFPTDKFLRWLRLFHLDIEIEDSEGNRTQKTMFPSDAAPTTASNMETTHVMNWQTSGETPAATDVPSTKSAHAILHNKSGTHIVMSSSDEQRVFQSSSGTQALICDAEPDSTSSESLEALSRNSATSSSGVGLQGDETSTADDDQDPESKKDILQSLMGKSAQDIFKDSPACKTMMSLSEMVANDKAPEEESAGPANVPRVDALEVLEPKDKIGPEDETNDFDDIDPPVSLSDVVDQLRRDEECNIAAQQLSQETDGEPEITERQTRSCRYPKRTRQQSCVNSNQDSELTPKRTRRGLR